MSLLPMLLPASPPAPTLHWVRVATRPGSGLGLLPAALSVQPGATLGALMLAGLAAALAPRLGSPAA